VENFILNDLYPDVRITSPDSLDVLGNGKNIMIVLRRK
jgi:hypothetical protein